MLCYSSLWLMHKKIRNHFGWKIFISSFCPKSTMRNTTGNYLGQRWQTNTIQPDLVSNFCGNPTTLQWSSIPSQYSIRLHFRVNSDSTISCIYFFTLLTTFPLAFDWFNQRQKHPLTHLHEHTHARHLLMPASLAQVDHHTFFLEIWLRLYNT